MDGGEQLGQWRSSLRRRVLLQGAVRLAGSDRRFQENCVYIIGHDFFGYCYDAMPSYASYDLGSGTVSQVVLDRMPVIWPALMMGWFFPQEQV